MRMTPEEALSLLSVPKPIEAKYDQSGNLLDMWPGVSPPDYQTGDLIEIHLARVVKYTSSNIMGRKGFYALVLATKIDFNAKVFDLLILGTSIRLRLHELGDDGDLWNSKLVSRIHTKPGQKVILPTGPDYVT